MDRTNHPDHPDRPDRHDPRSMELGWIGRARSSKASTLARLVHPSRAFRGSGLRVLDYAAWEDWWVEQGRSAVVTRRALGVCPVTGAPPVPRYATGVLLGVDALADIEGRLYVLFPNLRPHPRAVDPRTVPSLVIDGVPLLGDPIRTCALDEVSPAPPNWRSGS